MAYIVANGKHRLKKATLCFEKLQFTGEKRLDVKLAMHDKNMCSVRMKRKIAIKW
jgi:hypothetical protein